jgi:hypothetical protein
MEEVRQEGDFKIKTTKATPKKLNKKETITKIDLTNKKDTNAIQEQSTDEGLLGGQKPEVGLQEMGQGNEVTEVITENNEKEVIEVVEVSTENIKEERLQEIVNESKETGEPLPENIQKLVSFMKETGGTIEDYARLNTDYSKVKGEVLLKEYYKKARPHLDDEEIQFLMEEQFSYDEELDDERDIRKKRLAFKEEVARAQSYFEEVKLKYYDEIKLKPSINKDQQEAYEFFNRYKKDQERSEQLHSKFKEDTQKLFSNEFKGFEFNLGEKTLRYNVQNPNAVVEKQSNISNIIKKFLNENGEVTDVKGYHKAMYVADNSDTIMKQIYEQGKADGIKEVMAKSNNIANEPRTTAPESLFVNGMKIKAINGVDSTKLKIKKIT